MNEYVVALRKYVAENPPNFGSDAHSILEMLYTYYHECNNTDNDDVKAAFENLYQRMHGRIGSWMLFVPSVGNMKGLGSRKELKLG